MKKDEPQVGIFWLVGGKLLIDSTPVSAAEPYGVHLTHPRSHLEVWTLLLRSGKVPSGSEYEEFPRGRVIYGTKTRRFTLLADKCILKERGLVKSIKSAMGLPNDATIGPDSHYRCFACLRKRAAE